MKNSVPFVLFVLAVSSAAHAQTTLTLYNGALGTLPDQQGHLTFFGTVPDAVGKDTGSTWLFTRDDQAIQAGFATHNIFGQRVNNAFPELNRHAGYWVHLKGFGILDDIHSSDSRSGFSLIVIGHDRKGIELEFRRDGIFALSDSPIFTKAETAPIVQGMSDYWVRITGNQYSLGREDYAFLTGPLRDYSAFVPPLPVIADPYETPNFIFIGDSSTSAGADSVFAGLSVTVDRVVPEPTAALTALLLTPAALLRRRSR